jgi:hypothetical protein
VDLWNLYVGATPHQRTVKQKAGVLGHTCVYV